MIDELMLETEERMIGAINALTREFSKVRTGRANPKLLDPVMVNYYGAPTPMNQLGNISVPEPNQLLIKPYDRTVMKEAEKAIHAANLGVTPQNEGEQIRIVLPKLTEERRKVLVRDVKKLSEDAKVAVRNIRRDINDAIKKAQKASEITEDDAKAYLEEVQDLTDQYIAKVEEELAGKEKDLMQL